MSRYNLAALAAGKSKAWSSSIVTDIAGVRLKVLRMDATPYPEEVHDYREGLLVLEGEMRLQVEGRPVRVAAGEIYVVEPGVRHAVEPGSHGVLAILDS